MWGIIFEKNANLKKPFLCYCFCVTVFVLIFFIFKPMSWDIMSRNLAIIYIQFITTNWIAKVPLKSFTIWPSYGPKLVRMSIFGYTFFGQRSSRDLSPRWPAQRRRPQIRLSGAALPVWSSRTYDQKVYTSEPRKPFNFDILKSQNRI